MKETDLAGRRIAISFVGCSEEITLFQKDRMMMKVESDGDRWLC